MITKHFLQRREIPDGLAAVTGWLNLGVSIVNQSQMLKNMGDVEYSECRHIFSVRPEMLVL